MHRICGLDVELDEREAKYYKRVFKFCSIVPLITFFLLSSLVVSNLIEKNYLLSIFVIIFTIYFLYIIRIDKVGTKQHLYAGLMLVGSYIFYSTTTYNITIATILAFNVFISYINGRELQARANKTN